MQAHRLHIKFAELNTPSDGNGISGIPSAVFFIEMGNKKNKLEIKIRKKLRKLSQLHAFSFFKCKFEKFLIISNDCKSNVSAHQSCTIEHSSGWNIATFGSVLHTLLKLKTRGIFMYLFIFYCNFFLEKQ